VNLLTHSLLSYYAVFGQFVLLVNQSFSQSVSHVISHNGRYNQTETALIVEIDTQPKPCTCVQSVIGALEMYDII